MKGKNGEKKKKKKKKLCKKAMKFPLYLVIWGGIVIQVFREVFSFTIDIQSSNQSKFVFGDLLIYLFEKKKKKLKFLIVYICFIYSLM